MFALMVAAQRKVGLVLLHLFKILMSVRCIALMQFSMSYLSWWRWVCTKLQWNTSTGRCTPLIKQTPTQTGYRYPFCLPGHWGKTLNRQMVFAPSRGSNLSSRQQETHPLQKHQEMHWSPRKGLEWRTKMFVQRWLDLVSKVCRYYP